MKKIIVGLILCIVLSFSLFSCGNQNKDIVDDKPDTTITDNNDPYTFDNIANLISAVKRDLDKYENMQVSVKGSILKKDDQIMLSDARGDGGVQYRANAMRSANITVIVSNDKKATILDDGDYIKISGSVKISDTGIYLDNCDYEVIESVYG